MSALPQGTIFRFWVIGLLTSSCCGCATGLFRSDSSLDHQRSIYYMYDNSRDWGPSYLLEPPNHYLGDETRIDDSRSTLTHESAPQSIPAPAVTTQLLPPLP